MLTEQIMHTCVMKLLKDRDEESLECMCKLLTTIGQMLDHEKAKVICQFPSLIMFVLCNVLHVNHMQITCVQLSGQSSVSLRPLGSG